MVTLHLSMERGLPSSYVGFQRPEDRPLLVGEDGDFGLPHRGMLHRRRFRKAALDDIRHVPRLPTQRDS
jgi:hypothetical protein